MASPHDPSVDAPIEKSAPLFAGAYSAGDCESDRLMEQAASEANEAMKQERAELGRLLLKGRESEFCARLPAFLKMSFAWLDGPAVETDWDDPYDGYSLVGMACEEGLVQALKDLLAAGASQSSPLGDDNDALHVVARYNKKNAACCVRALIEAGADVNAPNALGQTPLELAARVNSVEMTACLLARGATVRESTEARPGLEQEARDNNALAALGALVAWREAREIKQILGEGAPALPASARL